MTFKWHSILFFIWAIVNLVQLQFSWSTTAPKHFCETSPKVYSTTTCLSRGGSDPTGAAHKLGGAQCGECPSQTGKTMIRTTCSPGWLVIEGSLWPFRHTDTHSLLSLSYIHPGFLQTFVLFGKRPRSSWTGPFAEMAQNKLSHITGSE